MASELNPAALEILQVAVRLFAQHGFGATSTREIAEAAGVTKPMLYYYFQSKEGLCQAAVDYYFNRFLDRLQAVVDASHGPQVTLVELAWTYLTSGTEDKQVVRFFLGIFYGPDRDRLGLDFHAFIQREQSLLMRAIERADGAGLLKPGCKEAFMMALSGCVHVWNMRALEENMPLTHDVAERIVCDLLEGFGRA